MASLFSLHDGCISPSCIDLGVASPSQPPPDDVLARLATTLHDGPGSWLAGYPSPLGEPSSIAAIQRLYSRVGCDVPSESIVVTSGAHSEIILWTSEVVQNSVIGVQTPRYPAIETRSGTNQFRAVEFDAERNELDLSGAEQLDVLYVCSPHNPTGTRLSAEQLDQVVSTCLENQIVLLFDNVYCIYAKEAPFSSIYETPGAELCAVEFNSLSKTANMAGLRFGWTIVPTSIREGRMQSIRAELAFALSAGVSRLDQAAGRLALTWGSLTRQKTVAAQYLRRTTALASSLEAAGLRVVGGRSLPMLWIQVPEPHQAVDFVKLLHDELDIFVSAGPIFGGGQEGRVRVSAFAEKADIREASLRLEGWGKFVRD